MIAILYNIRSAHNVGSIFRTADAVGIRKLYLCGITPDPIDRFGRVRTDVTKASLGAEKSVLWEHVGKKPDTRATLGLISRLKKEGFIVIALEQYKKSKNVFTYHSSPKKEIALVVGNEVEGIPTSILNRCDAVVEIPMSGEKESLNVSVAFGIAGYALRNLQ